MKRMLPWLLVIVLTCVMVAPAFAGCADQPQQVRAYLAAHPGWQMRVLTDMDKSEQAEWRQYNGDACPGFTALDMDGSGKTYAVLVEQVKKPGRPQKAVLLGTPGVPDRTIVELKTPVAMIINRVPADDYGDHADGRHVHLHNDGLAFASWGAGAQGYYFDGGKLKHFALSI